MNKIYHILILIILATTGFSRSMEFMSCKTYVKVEKNLEEGEKWGLKALEVEPENSFIPFFIGQFIYRKQKRRIEAGKMFIEALNRPNSKIETKYKKSDGI